MTGVRRWAVLAAVGLVLAGAGCGDDADPGPEAAPGADGEQTADDGNDGTTEDGDAAQTAPGGRISSCDDVSRDMLELVAPGLEPEEPTGPAVPFFTLHCVWDSDAVFLQLTLTDFASEDLNFTPEDLLAEHVDNPTVDLCELAYLSEDFGLDITALDDERVWSIGATQVGTPVDERMSVEEGVERLIAFGEAVTGC